MGTTFFYQASLRPFSCMMPTAAQQRCAPRSPISNRPPPFGLHRAGLGNVLTVFKGGLWKIATFSGVKNCRTVDSGSILGIPGEAGATLADRGGPGRCPFQQDVVISCEWALSPKKPTEPPLKARVASNYTPAQTWSEGQNPQN